jgi:hypothetical protein
MDKYNNNTEIDSTDKKLHISDVSGSEKLYSVDDIHKIIRYMNKNYSKTEDELARPYEDKGEDLPDDFFEGAYNFCLKQAIDSIG